MADDPQAPPPHELAATDAAALALTSLFAIAEAAILARFAKILAATPPTAAGRAGLLMRLRHSLRQVLAQVTPHLPEAIAQLAQTATEEGTRRAERVTIPHDDPGLHPSALTPPAGPPPVSGALGAAIPDPWETHAEASARAIRQDLASTITEVLDRVTRVADDVYREVTAAATTQQVLGIGVTPQAAQAQAWTDYAARGVTGFTDRSGRSWALSSYVEMSVRTTAMRAYNAAYEDRLQALGIRYFTVPGDGHPCPLCLPWQGCILTPGANPDPAIKTDGTVAEARHAGLFHPNCRHVLAPYFPGVTMADHRATWNDEHQAAYDATQRLRALERRVRAAKQAEQHAASPYEATKARKAIRDGQAAIRAHVATSSAIRRPRREQVNLGMK
jgi:hypothetical protein